MKACSVSFSSLEKHVSTWGRRLAWIRIHAWGACDPGFKSQRPHHNSSGPIGDDFTQFFSHFIFASCALACPLIVTVMDCFRERGFGEFVCELFDLPVSFDIQFDIQSVF
jgi:hypothetical protein